MVSFRFKVGSIVQLGIFRFLFHVLTGFRLQLLQRDAGVAQMWVAGCHRELKADFVQKALIDDALEHVLGC